MNPRTTISIKLTENMNELTSTVQVQHKVKSRNPPPLYPSNISFSTICFEKYGNEQFWRYNWVHIAGCRL